MRRTLMVEARGERFRFYFEGEGLHIQQKHGTNVQHAIDTFFNGRKSEWDVVHLRFESATETHAIYWTHHAYDNSIIIISCWQRGEE